MSGIEQTAQGRQKSGYDRRLRRLKAWLYAIPVLAFLGCVMLSSALFSQQFEYSIMPQIRHAIIEMAQVLPDLEADEAAVRKAYETMVDSRRQIMESGMPVSRAYDTDRDGVEAIISDNLSWMARMTDLKVGHDGAVIVVSRKDGTILAHPDSAYEGQELMVYRFLSKPESFLEEVVEEVENSDAMVAIEDIDIDGVSLEDIGSSIYSDDFSLKHMAVIPKNANTIRGMLDGMLDACIVSYKDTYIVCGIGLPELLSYLSRGISISVMIGLALWVFVKYICLQLERRALDFHSLRNKLLAYGSLLFAGIFLVTWYLQILSAVTLELKTMESHARAAALTLDDYRESRKNIDAWLDEQYLSQCRVAADYIAYASAENISRRDMAVLAEQLGVRYVSVFDVSGKTVVTNSPYDHLSLSRNPTEWSYGFLPLLEGEDHVIQAPRQDRSGNDIQYIGVSLRNGEDLCDGCVLIGVDTLLRTQLLEPLDVTTVLANLVIGLPEHAIAIDKDTLTVSATNGIGFVSEPIENIGLSGTMLQGAYSGYVTFGGDTYYAGFSESSDLFLVPMVPKRGNLSSLLVSLEINLVTLAAIALILLSSLSFHRREAPDKSPEAAREANEAGRGRGHRHAIRELLHLRDKSGFERRWHASLPREEQTPAMRIRRIIYRILLVFCVINLLPLFYLNVYGDYDTTVLSGMAFVVSGDWQKGLNIFALSSCLLLLFALYVFIVVADGALYWIARVSDMRTETICLLLRSSLKYICAVVFVYYGLSQLGIPSQTLLASAGIMTLVIGMGAKDFVNDIVAGFFILFEGNFEVGDYVTVNGFSGTVEEIGIRTTKVHSFGETKMFNNSSMRDVVNAVGPSFRLSVKVKIAYDADLKAVEAVLNEALPKLYEVIPGLVSTPTLQGVSDMDSESVTLSIIAFSEKDARYAAQRALTRHVKLIFDEHNINVPYHHIIVHKGAADT